MKGGHACSNVANRDANPGRPFHRAIDGAKATFRLDQEIIGLLIAPGPLAAIAGNRADDQALMFFPKIMKAKTQALHDTRTEILDQHVGLLDHRCQDLFVLCRFEIQTNRFLAPVQPDEIGTSALGMGIIAARKIPFRPFDLDDPSPSIRKLAGGIRSRHGMFDRHDQKAFQITHRFKSPFAPKSGEQFSTFDHQSTIRRTDRQPRCRWHLQRRVFNVRVSATSPNLAAYRRSWRWRRKPNEVATPPGRSLPSRALVIAKFYDRNRKFIFFGAVTVVPSLGT